jgi:MOSC domain-containing protein YiiM
MKTGTVDHLFIKPGHREDMIPVETIRVVQQKGIQGDASFGRSKRQILIISNEVITAYGLMPGDLRENITVSQLKVDAIPTEARLSIGDVVLEVTGTCDPCTRLEELRVGLMDEIQGNRGILARVLEPGEINVGQTISQDKVEIHTT